MGALVTQLNSVKNYKLILSIRHNGWGGWSKFILYPVCELIKRKHDIEHAVRYEAPKRSHIQQIDPIEGSENVAVDQFTENTETPTDTDIQSTTEEVQK